MLVKIIKWIGGIATALALLDGVFGGGERLWAIANFLYPPRPDPAYELKALSIGYMPDKFEKTGVRTLGIGVNLYNANTFPLFYEIEKADYSIEDFQNASDDNEDKGRVLPKRMESLRLSPIYMKFLSPKVYNGEAHIVVKYGRREHRLGNELKLLARLRYSPGAPPDRQFEYALLPGSAPTVRSTMQPQ